LLQMIKVAVVVVVVDKADVATDQGCSCCGCG